ncbi:MAG: hypothetical protein ACFFGZ_07710 [Candidatus Thorarchaeota archaeon]
MPTEIRNLTRRYGRMLVSEGSDFFHCCMKCEVATALESVEACPQRVHTSNSCCPSCGHFLEHGSEAMLAHWEDQAQFLVAFQVVLPLKISEEVIRSAFGLHKVPMNQLKLFYEWKRNARTLDVAFEKHIEWSMTLRQTYWDLNLEDAFLRDPLIYGLAGFPDRAGAAAFSQLRQVVEDFKEWCQVVHQIDPEELFQDDLDSISQSFASYFISYFLRFENAENLTIEILAPDYEHSRDPESCLVIEGDKQVPLVSFQSINEVLVMQKGLLTSWHMIEPALQHMLEELAEITADMRITQVDSTVPHLSELLDRVQTIQEQFLKLKPTISNMQGQISPIVPLLSEPLIEKLLPYFNLNLINSWLDFTKSVERSVDGANTYIGGKMDLLALNQERRTTKRINLLTALFGILSGMNLIMAYLAWATPNPTQEALIFSAVLTTSLIAVSVAIAARVIWKE